MGQIVEGQTCLARGATGKKSGDSGLQENQSDSHAQDKLRRSSRRAERSQNLSKSILCPGAPHSYTSIFMAKERKAKRSDLLRVPELAGGTSLSQAQMAPTPHHCSFVHTLPLPRIITERKEEN